MTASDQLLLEMRQDLVAAASKLDPAPVDRRPRWLAVAAVLALVAGVAGVVLSSDDSASADLEVLRQGDELLVTLHDVESRPDEIEAAAAAAGLDVSVVEVPVGPSNVGRFAGAEVGRMPGVLTIDRNDPSSSFTGFRIPLGFDAPITLELGRAARTGEQWAIPSSATAAGEPLACAAVTGRPLADVLDLIGAAGLAVPRVLRGEDGRTIASDALADSGNLIVVSAEAQASGPLTLFVVADPASIPPRAATPDQGCG